MFTVATHHTAEAVIVELAGDLDTLAAQELDTRLEALVASSRTDFVIAMAQVQYLNSTGVRSFIRLDRLLKATGRSFRFTGVSSRIYRIFRYCGLDRYFTFEPQQDAGAEKGLVL